MPERVTHAKIRHVFVGMHGSEAVYVTELTCLYEGRPQCSRSAGVLDLDYMLRLSYPGGRVSEYGEQERKPT